MTRQFSMLLFGIISWILTGLLGGYIAAHKGYAPQWWFVLAVLFGPVSIAIAVALSPTEDALVRAEEARRTQEELAHSRQTQPCPKCRRRNSVIARICPQCHYRFTADPPLGGR